jgi:hypothetical protein
MDSRNVETVGAIEDGSGVIVVEVWHIVLLGGRSREHKGNGPPLAKGMTCTSKTVCKVVLIIHL